MLSGLNPLYLSMKIITIIAKIKINSTKCLNELTKIYKNLCSSKFFLIFFKLFKTTFSAENILTSFIPINDCLIWLILK